MTPLRFLAGIGITTAIGAALVGGKIALGYPPSPFVPALFDGLAGALSAIVWLHLAGRLV